VRTLEREPDERPLICAAQTDPAQFARLYEQNFDRIYAFFTRRVATREEAQDLTAEVFHYALASIRNFKWQGAPFVAWLYGIAGNVLAGHWQKEGKIRPLEEDDLSDAGDEIEQSVMLGQLVDALLPDQRRVVMRRFIDQKSIREIAQELGRSEGAVKQLQLRALENLRDKLGRKS
jgi:RNA polymerase sigma-70 factor (ECF subfamily)